MINLIAKSLSSYRDYLPKNFVENHGSREQKKSTSGRCASLKTSSRLHEEQKAGGRPTPEPGDPSSGENVSP